MRLAESSRITAASFLAKIEKVYYTESDMNIRHSVLFMAIAVFLMKTHIAWSEPIAQKFKDSLSYYAFGTEAYISFATGELSDFYGFSGGAEVSVERNFLHQITSHFTLGTSFRLFAETAFKKRIEISTLYALGFFKGIYILLPVFPEKIEGLAISFDAGAGFTFTNVAAENVYEEKIDRYYADFSFRLSPGVRKTVYEHGTGMLWLTLAVPITVRIEGSGAKCTAGLSVGILSDFSKWKIAGGVQNEIYFSFFASARSFLLLRHDGRPCRLNWDKDTYCCF